MRIIKLVLVLFIGVIGLCSYAQKDIDSLTLPIMTFEKTGHDWGIINEGDIVETEFAFTNTGKTDLIITNIKGSCGCTIPSWDKTPITSGATSKFTVKFNSVGKSNNQQKTVTISCNTENGIELVTIKAQVLPKLEVENSETESVAKIIKPKGGKEKYDILLLDLLRLRNKKLYISKNLFTSVWKNSDSISKPYIAECGPLEGENILIYHFKGISFIVYQDNAELESIDFEICDENLVYKKITFNKNTTLDEIKRKFKISYGERDEQNSNGNQYVTLRFKTHKNWDEYIHLLFKNSKLIYFNIWSPC